MSALAIKSSGGSNVRSATSSVKKRKPPAAEIASEKALKLLDTTAKLDGKQFKKEKVVAGADANRMDHLVRAILQPESPESEAPPPQYPKPGESLASDTASASGSGALLPPPIPSQLSAAGAAASNPPPPVPMKSVNFKGWYQLPEDVMGFEIRYQCKSIVPKNYSKKELGYILHLNYVLEDKKSKKAVSNGVKIPIETSLVDRHVTFHSLLGPQLMYEPFVDEFRSLLKKHIEKSISTVQSPPTPHSLTAAAMMAPPPPRPPRHRTTASASGSGSLSSLPPPTQQTPLYPQPSFVPPSTLSASASGSGSGSLGSQPPSDPLTSISAPPGVSRKVPPPPPPQPSIVPPSTLSATASGSGSGSGSLLDSLLLSMLLQTTVRAPAALNASASGSGSLPPPPPPQQPQPSIVPPSTLSASASGSGSGSLLSMPPLPGLNSSQAGAGNSAPQGKFNFVYSLTTDVGGYEVTYSCINTFHELNVVKQDGDYFLDLSYTLRHKKYDELIANAFRLKTDFSTIINHMKPSATGNTCSLSTALATIIAPYVKQHVDAQIAEWQLDKDTQIGALYPCLHCPVIKGQPTNIVFGKLKATAHGGYSSDILIIYSQNIVNFVGSKTVTMTFSPLWNRLFANHLELQTAIPNIMMYKIMQQVCDF